MTTVLTIYFLILVLAVLVGIFINTQGYDVELTVAILIMSSSAILCYAKDTQRYDTIKKKLLRPSLLLLLGMSIIVLQITVDLLIGNLEIDSNVFYHRSVITKGVSFGAIAMVSYILGGMMAQKPFSYTREPERVPLTFLTIMSIVFAALFVGSLDAAFFTGQAYIDSGDISETHTNNSEVFLNVCNTALIIQYAINQRGKNLNFVQYVWGLPKPFIAIYILYIVLVLIGGARFPALRDLLLLLFAYIYSTHKQPVNNKMVVILMVAASVMFAMISFSRVFVTGDLSAKYNMGMQGLENSKSFSPTTAELAHSQYCDMLAIDLFEKRDVPFLKGAFQARYMAVNIIPNRILQNIWPVTIDKQGSAYYLTAKDMGLDAEIGLGTTIQSDFYMDFGLLGMIICMILVGVLLKKIDLTIYHKTDSSYGVFVILIVVYLSACAFYLSRAPFVPMFRIPMYAYVLIKINALFFRQRTV